MEVESVEQSSLFKESQSQTIKYSHLILNKQKLLQLLYEVDSYNEINTVKGRISALKGSLSYGWKDKEGILNIDKNGDTISLRSDVLLSELDQILEVKTIERAKYYIKRLENGIQKIKTNKVNDINLLRWKEYDNIITDSLWIEDKRDGTGGHIGWYWGNFIPQIPHQMMLRYTKKGDWVLDAFVGSGTTLIECRRLGRNGIGIELNEDIVEKAKQLIQSSINRYNVITKIVKDDCRTTKINDILRGLGLSKFQLLIMHPPYHDIIKFSDNDEDLSGAKNVNEFLKMFGDAVSNATPFLEKGRYFALVIGDKYSKGEWIPLGFYCMNEVLNRGYILKSIIVKNFEETRGKRNQKELWRYRALVGGFYIFKHEYVMVFKRSQ